MSFPPNASKLAAYRSTSAHAGVAAADPHRSHGRDGGFEGGCGDLWLNGSLGHEIDRSHCVRGRHRHAGRAAARE